MGTHDMRPLAGRSSLDVDRRHVIAGLVGLAAGMALPAARARAATAPHRFKVGAIEITVISDGHLEIPVPVQLPSTPDAQIDALFKANSLEPPRQLSPATNVVLIKSGDEQILVDAGSGSSFQPTAGKLAENMEAAGIDREAITRVVFTHAHADHLWGAIDDFDDSERFPNARYAISAEEFDFWRKEDDARMPEMMKGMAMTSRRILGRLEPKLDRLKGGDAVMPGISLLATPGHTPGHVSILVENGRDQLLIGGDVLAHPQISFQKPEWPIGSDTDRDVSIATRGKVLDRLATDRVTLIGFHLTGPGVGRVERAGTAYRFVPA